MRDYIFIAFAISLTTAITYFAYKLLWGVSGSVADLQITPEEIIQQMKILMVQKKYDIVEKLGKNYLKNKTFCHDVRILLAKSYYENGDYTEAVDNIKFLIKYQPKVTDHRILLANCYRALKKPELAIDTYQSILEYEFNNYWVMRNIAILYLETNQKFSAIKMYEKMIDFLETVNDKIETKMILAELYFSINDNAKSIQHYKEILEIFPDDLMAKMALCEVYERIKNFDDLVNLANNICECSIDARDELWGLQKLLNAYRTNGYFEDALEIAKRINDNNVSDKVKARDDMAQILVQLHRAEEGIEIWNSLIEEVPTNSTIKKNLATAYLRENDYDTAISIYKKLLDEAPAYEIPAVNEEIGALYANWGLYLFNEGDTESCFKKFNTALQYSPENSVIYWKLGCIDKAINNYKEALTNFKKALELDDSIVDYYYEIAECYEVMDSIYDQKKYLSESLKIDDTNANVYYKLGINFKVQNDLNSAITHMEKAVELDVNFVDAKLKLALMYEHVGKIEEAARLYEDVLRIEPDNEEAINNLHMLEN